MWSAWVRKMRHRLSRLRRLHLPFATVFADVTGLRKVGVMFTRLAGDFLAVRAEFVSGFLKFGGHTDSLC